ncbi:HEAT repeat domain-containing protein [Oscillatoria sp. FACHB-1406]|uniref:HEAT repeat domain-containing protein n=1 Tax=Oscillatoria sp. FACHB-1406 TaxID=2692846 RepID=UPI0016821C8D|nr:HEAT repeat domain-containing protein [Oscillatoria sp. FACHB-1406]MBD2578086.1 HEAT repeat domain-containing protein [Oscillatoria sp. FACHB-1406]
MNESKSRVIQVIRFVLLNDESSLVRIEAAKALATMGVDCEDAISALCEAALSDRDSIVRQNAISALAQIYQNHPILNSLDRAITTMSESRKVQMNFNAPVTGAAGNVERDFINNPSPTLANAAAEIQQLLTQLNQTYPATTESEQQQLVRRVDEQVQTNTRIRGMFLAGGIELIKILCPYLGIPIEMGMKWLETANRNAPTQ